MFCVSSQDGRTLFVSRNPRLLDNDRWSTPVVSKKFCFDETFNEHTSQVDVYNALIHENIQKAFEGNNFSVFTIGQSGSGKVRNCSLRARVFTYFPASWVVGWSWRFEGTYSFCWSRRKYSLLEGLVGVGQLNYLNLYY